MTISYVSRIGTVFILFAERDCLRGSKTHTSIKSRRDVDGLEIFPTPGKTDLMIDAERRISVLTLRRQANLLQGAEVFWNRVDTDGAR
jgi:hypothetical protein